MSQQSASSNCCQLFTFVSEKSPFRKNSLIYKWPVQICSLMNIYDESCVLENTWLKVAVSVESQNVLLWQQKLKYENSTDKLHPVVMATAVVK